MVTSTAATVDAYLDELAPERRAIVARLRALVRSVAPDAAESMRYGMPTYDLGGVLYAVASQKQYLSVYVADTALVATYADRLGKVSLSKRCIRFRSLEQVNLSALEELMSELAAKRRGS